MELVILNLNYYYYLLSNLKLELSVNFFSLEVVLDGATDGVARIFAALLPGSLVRCPGRMDMPITVVAPDGPCQEARSCHV